MQRPFVFNNRFRGQNKADYEDAYFDYMNNSNAVANYPLTTKRNYIRNIRESRNAEYNPLNPLGTNLPDYSGMFNANGQNLKMTPSYGVDLSFLNEPIQEVNGPFLENYVRPIQRNEEQIDENDEDTKEEAEAMEYGRRNLIQQNFTPLQTPNYSQQAILPQQSASDIFNQNRDSVLAQKKAENKQINKQIRRENRKERWNNFNQKWDNGLGDTVGGVASAAGTIGDAFLQQSFSNNQNTALSGAFSFGNEKVDEINGVNKSLNATDFGNLQGQYNNQNSILNGYKTKTLSKGQIGGMAGVGAAKGAAAGSAFGPYGAAIGAVVGAGAGLGKGLLANKKIKETNDAASFAQQGLNNSYLATAQNIRNIYANNKKSDMYNNQAYYGANGGYLYANGGLMNPYGINYNVGDIIDVSEKEINRLKKMGYEFRVIA